MNPIFPTGPLNYLLGLTDMRLGTYSIVTFVFLLPPALAVSFIGYTAGSLAFDNAAEPIKMMFLASFGVTVLVGGAYVARLFKSGQGDRSSNSSRSPETS
jgi:uncharacterized membrane protein YdjX (TVP38/TMEM64 family)